jgi:acylphosphatase
LRRRYVVSGRVQGVGFRQFTADKARALRISGWVRNLAAGSVAVEAEADETAIAEFEKYLQKGPGFARVDELFKEDLKTTNTLPAPFEIRR